MRRSEINVVMRDGVEFMEERGFLLPPFAFWTPEEWQAKGPECVEIPAQQLGWDITDFGSGDFERCGLFLFTVRNGAASEGPAGKTYAEKIMIVREGQVTPTHFHFQKMEDIINRGGGDLVIQLWNSARDESLADSPITVSMDGVRTTVEPGGKVTLQPGRSITLTPGLYHRFWGRERGGWVLVGEVSRVNDDHTDNRFLEQVGRFPAIEEDEPPLHLLMGDYPRFYRYA